MHESLNRLARAGADNDAIADERGLEAAITALELDADDVRHVAEQRALRAVMVESGRADELAAAHAHGSSRPQGFALDTAERARLTFYTAIYMDGIALGVRSERTRDAVTTCESCGSTNDVQSSTDGTTIFDLCATCRAQQREDETKSGG